MVYGNAPLCLTLSYDVRLAGSTALAYRCVMKKDASVTLRLPSDLRERLQKLADADERDLSAYVRRALERHADEAERQIRPAASRRR